LWSHPLVHIGPLARTVADAALMTSVMAGPHPGDPLSLPDDGVDYLRAAGDTRRNFRVAFSPRLGDFPVDKRVTGVVKLAVEALERNGLDVDEVDLNFGADHDTLARLWVRIISLHYAAIARHWKQEGVDLLGESAEKLTPQFRQTLIDAGSIPAVDHALDDVLRTGVFIGLQSVFERYDLIVSPTLAIPPVRNASDGNTLGPTEINGKSVEPLIGWCMTFPINFTGHPAISIPAGMTPEGLPIGLQIIGRRHGDESVLALASRFEQAQPWLQNYPTLDKRTA
jgi:amidase/aspartyl-tRNA(Asn)/glutamyl-tRNA(Gln) amidotransferase subunit A